MRHLILFLLCALTAVAQITNINFGTTANDRSGDTLRTAGGKMNTNVAWLASQLGSSTNASATLSNQIFGTTLAVKNISVETNLNAAFVNGVSSNSFVDIQFPFVGTTLYSFGTSHTAGGVGYSYTTNYISSVGTIDEKFRYPTLIKNKFSFSTLNNYGASGTTFRFNTNDSTIESAHINRIGGFLPINWTGTTTMDFGYNDGYQQYAGSEFGQPFLQAYRAVIARGLCDYYVTAAGKDSSFSSYTWTSSGTLTSHTVQTYNNPFPTAASDTARVYSQLTGTQTLSVSVTNWNNAAIFFDQTATGGQAIVFAGTNQGPAITSYVPFVNVGSSGFYNDRLVGCVLLRNLSGTTTISITNQFGTNAILAIARIANTISDRSIIVDSPPISRGLLRDQGVLLQMGAYSRAAVSEFQEWPVYFADVAKAINPVEHQIHPTLDPYHWNPAGLIEFASAFYRAKKPNPDSGYSWQENRFANLTGSEQVTIDGDSSNSKNLFYKVGGVTRYGIAVSSSGNLYIQSYNSSGSFLNNNLEIVNSTGAANFGAAVTVGGSLNANVGATVNETINLDGDAVNPKNLFFKINGVKRYGIAIAPSGELYFQSYNSSGTLVNNNIIVGNSTPGLTLVGDVSLSGALSFGDGSGNDGMSLKSGQNNFGYMDINTGTTNRWRIAKNSATESGSNAGGNLVVERYSDAGAYLGTPITINRSTGRVGIGDQGTPIQIRAGSATLGAGGTVIVFDSNVTVSSNIQLTTQVTGGTPGWLRVSARTAGVSFTITSSSATDTSTVGWVMVEH